MFWLIEADIHTRGTLSSRAVVFFKKSWKHEIFFTLSPVEKCDSRNENVGNLI